MKNMFLLAILIVLKMATINVLSGNAGNKAYAAVLN